MLRNEEPTSCSCHKAFGLIDALKEIRRIRHCVNFSEACGMAEGVQSEAPWIKARHSAGGAA
jgi:hypothetical protein